MADWIKPIRAAARWPLRSDPANSQFFLPRAQGNHQAGNIRLNTELVKKPKDLLEYVVVHEMISKGCGTGACVVTDGDESDLSGRLSLPSPKAKPHKGCRHCRRCRHHP
ncbi:M48 family metallopeptidase [Pseudomonas rhodesiae]|uniref:M48 metallopeptidase family protein n=1 Tax=Pseudomonas rhodesiae TaxID=76760 RepID=UPI00244B51FF|nr:M48 family metallopeptidase [Pseudomonas rhodesiae]